MKPLIDKNSFLILLSLVVISMAWRPYLFGFYSDDYNIILEPISNAYSSHELINYLFNLYGNRPLSAINAYILITFLGDSAYSWHLFSVLFSFIISFLILIICKIFNNNNLNIKLAIYASLWIILPTSFGFLSWPTCFITLLPAVFWYLMSFYFLIRNQKIGFNDLVLSLFFYTLCIFTYESFYFQFIPMIVTCMIYKKNFYKNKLYLKVGSLFFLLQIVAIIYNRLILAGGRKNFDFDFIINRVIAVINNPEYLYHVSIPIFFIFCFSCYTYYLYRQYKLSDKKLSNDQLMIINFMVGIFISICIYLSVGYSIRPFGLGSRTTLTFSVFISFIIFFIAKIQFANKEKLQFIHFVFPILLLLSVFYEGKDWAASKSIQQEVLDAFPVDKVSNLHNGLILCLVPNYAGDVLIFEDTWSLNPAITTKYKNLTDNKLIFLPHKNDGFRSSHSNLSKYTHQYLTLRSGHESVMYKTENVYIWNYFTKKIYVVDKEITIEAHSNLSSLVLDFDTI